jgi:hypothetical protein
MKLYETSPKLGIFFVPLGDRINDNAKEHTCSEPPGVCLMFLFSANATGIRKAESSAVSSMEADGKVFKQFQTWFHWVPFLLSSQRRTFSGVLLGT